MATKSDIEAVTLLSRQISPSLEEVPSSHDTDALLADNAICDSEQGERKDTEGESSVRLYCYSMSSSRILNSNAEKEGRVVRK